MTSNLMALSETCCGSGEASAAAGSDTAAAGAPTPIIDLSKLLDPLSSEDERAKLGSACHHWGLFQLVNHGVPQEVMSELKSDMAEFFKLPPEAKEAYSLSQLPNGLQGYGKASFAVSEEQKLDLGEMLFLVTRPSESRDMSLWPAHPPSSFSRSIDRFSSETAKVARCLLEFMAKDMGVDPESMLEMFQGQPQGMRMNYYHSPPCRRGDEVLGTTPHTDKAALTVLLQANGVQGLQIRKEKGVGEWLPVHALDGALIINIGYILEIMSNGRYKGVEHRVVVHPTKERFSVATFHRPCPDATVGPLAELVADDGEARYRSMSCLDYMKEAFAKIKRETNP